MQMVLGYAKHAHDYECRKRHREPGNQVDFVLIDQFIKKARSDLFDFRAESIDSSGQESLVDEPAHARVLGWVAKYDPQIEIRIISASMLRPASGKLAKNGVRRSGDMSPVPSAPFTS